MKTSIILKCSFEVTSESLVLTEENNTKERLNFNINHLDLGSSISNCFSQSTLNDKWLDKKHVLNFKV